MPPAHYGGLAVLPAALRENDAVGVPLECSARTVDCPCAHSQGAGNPQLAPRACNAAAAHCPSSGRASAVPPHRPREWSTRRARVTPPALAAARRPVARATAGRGRVITSPGRRLSSGVVEGFSHTSGRKLFARATGLPQRLRALVVMASHLATISHERAWCESC